MATMNVIPFIDIMLVLLAIVLTTATFVAQGKIPVVLPSASEAEPLQMEQTVEITVSDEGAIYVDEEAMDVAQLAQHLAGLEKSTRLLLRVDERAVFRHFVAVIDLLKAEGLRNLSIVTRRTGA